MSNIRIVTDSTCDIEPSLLNGYRLDILPLVISIEERSYLDGEEIHIEEVYAYMRKGVVPKTSQIPYERTYFLFRSILERGEDVLYISFSGELSGCFSLGSMVAEELRAEFSGRNIAVVDSKAGAGATGLIVLQALKMAAASLPFDMVKAETEFLADHIEHVFSVGDLEWLAKGGRIPKVVGYVGSKLGFHPILEVEKGRMVVRRMVRGKSNAIQAVANDIIQRAQKFPAQLVAICHADDLCRRRSWKRSSRRGCPAV
jgi:DegV family protein with EDD domain